MRELSSFFFFQAEDGIRDLTVTGVQTCALPICRDRCNDDSIGIELEGLEGLRFEPAQYAALDALCNAIAARYPVAHLAGHEHIAPGRKCDPGAGFDWHRLQIGRAHV